MSGVSVWHERRKKGSGYVYRVCWRDARGNRGSETLGPFMEPVRAFKQKKLKELSENKAGSSPRGRVRMEEVISLYLADRKNLAPHTLRNDKYAWASLVKEAGNCRIKELSDGMISDWKAVLLSEHSANYVRILMRSVRSTLNWCVSRGMIVESPARSVALPKEEEVGRVLTDDEISRLVAAEPRLSAPIRFTLYQAVRQHMILTLRWEWLDRSEPDSWKFRFPGEKAKNRKGQVIVLHPKSKALLEEIGIKIEGPVFPWKSRHALNDIWKLARTRAGIKGRLRWHDLKTTAVTRGLERGLDARTLMHLSGNRSAASFDHYAKMGQVLRSSMLEKLDYDF